MQNVERLCANFKNIIVIGYSYGGVLGIKLAEIFEKNGKKVKFISLDGSLILLKSFVQHSLKGLEPNSENLENWLLHQFSYEFPLILEKCDGLEIISNESKAVDKLKKALLSAEIEKYSDDFITKSFYGILNRLKAIIDTKESSEHKLAANIVLIRPKINIVNDIVEDYNLKLSTCHEVVIHYSEKRHLSLLEDEKVLNIIRNECRIN